MDKKNTMLLTVIAVATLLVAVVGATFAYFSIESQGSKTTTANVQTGSVPTIALESSVPSLNMYLTAADMVKGEAAVPYYAVTNTMSEGTSLKATSKQNHTIATLTATGGSAGDTYDCDLTITITKSGTMTLTEGDAKLYLSGLGVKTSDVPAEGLDLSTVESTKTISVKGLNISANGGSQSLTADVEVNNTTENQTVNMAGKNLKVDIKTELVSSSCKLHTAG